MIRFFEKDTFKHFCILFLIIFSYTINYYYSLQGVFPVDSFSHFDTGYRILLGEHPFKDYWAISGPVIDYLQSILFFIFGVSWKSYVAHSSIFNVVITVSTFYLFKKFNLSNLTSFIYAFFFSILAYPSSGTPFADHHSTFFSLLSIYAAIFLIKTEKKYYCFLISIFLVLGFFSKQVPSAYVALFLGLIIFIYILADKRYELIKYFACSFIFIGFFLFIFSNIFEISLDGFLLQYIFYPPSIGTERINNLNISFRNVILNYKFIYIFLLPYVFINIKKILKNNSILKNKNFYIFLILTSYVFLLIFHQLVTQNQIFIFFLIPLLSAFLHIELKDYKKKKYFFFIFFICLFATQKYHFRFNEDRKFHELSDVNFEHSIPASKIDVKFAGLNWITPYEKNPQREVDLINESKIYLKNLEKKKMVITNYSFFSAILDQKIYSPIRWVVTNGNSHPLNYNKYYVDYQEFLIDKIIKNKIKVIFTIKLNKPEYIESLLSNNCNIEYGKINQILDSYTVSNCVNF